MIIFSCPHCHVTVRMFEDALGKRCACPKCGGALQVPQAAAIWTCPFCRGHSVSGKLQRASAVGKGLTLFALVQWAGIGVWLLLASLGGGLSAGARAGLWFGWVCLLVVCLVPLGACREEYSVCETCGTRFLQ